MSKALQNSRLLTETTFYILFALLTPLHGYGVMKKVEEDSKGTVVIGAGTLYGAISKLLDDQLIEITSQDERRKYYQLTAKGKEVLMDQISKINIMAANIKRSFPNER